MTVSGSFRLAFDRYMCIFEGCFSSLTGLAMVDALLSYRKQNNVAIEMSWQAGNFSVHTI